MLASSATLSLSCLMPFNIQRREPVPFGGYFLGTAALSPGSEANLSARLPASANFSLKALLTSDDVYPVDRSSMR